MKTKVFLSYARKDTRRVNAVAEKLSQLNFDVWLDTRSIQGGDLWSLEISQAIRKCNFFVLFISGESMKSDPVRREVDLAYSCKRNMILIRLDPTEIPHEFAYQVSGIQWIDIQDKDWMAKFLIALGNRTARTARSAETKEASATSRKKATTSGVRIGGDAKNSIIIAGNQNSIRTKKGDT